MMRNFYLKITVMKKIFLLIFLSGFYFSIFAQISTLKPTHVAWNANKTLFSVKEAALQGVQIADSISLIIYIDAKLIKPDENLSFDFNWYRYGGTRKYLMDSYKLDCTKNNLKDNSYILSATKKNLQKGLWEVEIINKTDNMNVEFGGITKFQILIKE